MNEPKTVRVRIAVAVDAHGDWRAFGNPAARDDDVIQLTRDTLFRWVAAVPCHTVCWIEADVPIPEPATVEGVVTPAQE